MLRGSIELVHADRVAGWIYSSSESLRDKVILAFVAGRCVGAGKVDHFRRDLLEAQLGDGYCGFDFAINLNDGESLGAVVVRLQNSDAALIQATSRLIGPDDVEDGEPDLGAIPPQNLSWMRDHGWLEQHEQDFLRGIHSVGAYERALRVTRRNGGDPAMALKPEAVVQDMLGMYTLRDLTVHRGRVASISDLGAPGSPLRSTRTSVVALWCEERCRIGLEERSHLGPAASRGQVMREWPPGAIEYSFGPDRLLFLHTQCNFAPAGPAPAAGIIIFTAAAVGADVKLPATVPAPAREKAREQNRAA